MDTTPLRPDSSAADATDLLEMVVAAVNDVSNSSNVTVYESATAESTRDAKSVLIFVGLVVLLIVVGCIYFIYWDAYDHNSVVYKKSDSKETRSNVLVERVARGQEYNTFQKISRPLDIGGRILSCCGLKGINKEDYRKPMRSEFRDELNENFDDLWRSNIIGDMHEYDDVDIDDESIVGRKVVLKYINAALPFRPLLVKEGSELFRFLSLLFNHHGYISMYFRRSEAVSRTIRWLNMWRGVLVIIFVDTLFIKTVYPDDNVCPGHNAATSCSDLASKIGSHHSVCNWNALAQSCALIPPPRTMSFILTVMLFCLVVSMPINAVLAVILEDYASRRPKLSQLKLSENSWLGTTYNSMLMGKVHHEAAIARWASSREMKLTDLEIRQAAKLIYQSHASDEEELNFLLDKIRKYFRNSDFHGDAAHHRQFTAEAVSTSLGILPNGDPGPLTIPQLIRFGSPYNRLLYQIRKFRYEERGLLQKFLSCESHHRDLVLLHHFILEQVSFFKRFALRDYLRVHDAIAPPELDVYAWSAVWLALGALFVFFVYWEISWAVSIGRATLKLWGYVFGIAVLQDIFLCQTFKIFMMHIFAVEFSRKQLQNIYRTLVRVAMLSTAASRSESERYQEHHFAVVQHLSSACRAARSNEAFHLPSSFILRHITDVDIVRCREYRNKGQVYSFLVIIPAYLSSLQISLSDKLFELTLSGILTGALIAFKKVHAAAGPFFVALPFIVFVAFTLRVIYIRHRRAQKLKNSKRGTWSLSKRKQKLKLYFGSPLHQWAFKGFNCMAAMWRCEYRKNPKLHVVGLQWRFLNNMGAAGTVVQRKATDDTRIPASTRHPAREYAQLDIPSQIVALMPISGFRRDISVHKQFQARLFDTVELTVIELDDGIEDVWADDEFYSESFVELTKRELTVLTADHSKAVLSDIRRLSPVIDEPAALRYMFRICLRTRLVEVSGSYLSWYTYARQHDCKVDWKLLQTSLAHLWNVYVPLGIKLSRLEIDELDVLFTEWGGALWQQRGSLLTGNVKFSEFIEWFILVLDWITRQRTNLLPRSQWAIKAQGRRPNK
jgi:hypothetical protein